MRLTVLVFTLHFFMSGTLVHPASNHAVSFDLTDPRCTKIMEPLVVGAQLYDVIHTQDHLARDPNVREVDWWTSKFAGPRHRNIFGIAFGIALLDAIKWRLTAHSPALRCAVEANQMETTLDAIRVTH